MTTATLYQAYKFDVEGTLDRQAFWQTVFDTNGIFTDDLLNNAMK